jgi:hypothetical protein
MSNTPKRPWFRFHLLTVVVMMVTAAVILFGYCTVLRQIPGLTLAEFLANWWYTPLVLLFILFCEGYLCESVIYYRQAARR